MEWLLDSRQMKSIDEYSINNIGIPSLVLMERAALAVKDRIVSLSFTACCAQALNLRVLCICGRGNNGADGLAVARLLSQAGFEAEIMLAGGDKEGTDEYETQRRIVKNMGLVHRNSVHMEEYDYIVDAIFGIGLSRNVTGVYRDIIENINQAKNAAPHIKIISVDIPSGISADDGKVMGVAVRADETVTFGYNKLGLVMFPGAGYAGNVTAADIGFADRGIADMNFADKTVSMMNLTKEYSQEKGRREKYGTATAAYTYTIEDIKNIPKRRANVDKGKCGKILIAAGSKDMGGAACMSAGAAYRSGAGLVRVYTHADNREVLLGTVPEVIPVVYSDIYTDKDKEALRDSCRWADCIVVGPGLSCDDTACGILRTVLENADGKVVIMDADALNIVAADKDFRELVKNCAKRRSQICVENHNGAETCGCIIITPHVGEMSRLLGTDIAYIKENPVESAVTLANELSVICVLKDARTVVTDGKHIYINTTGNSGMATAGSGDVLTGVMAGMAEAGFDTYFEAAAMAVNVHGVSGDMCRSRLGAYGMKAWDIIEQLPEVYKIGEI